MMVDTLTAIHLDNLDHITSYAIGPELDAWNHVRHNRRLAQRFDLGRRLTRTRQDFYSYDGNRVTNWIPRRVQRIAYTIHAYLLLNTTARAHPIYDFISLLRIRWCNVTSNTLTNTPIPGNYRFAMYFETMGNTDHAIQRYGFVITEAILHTPITTTFSDEHGHEWSAHYDDDGRPCPHNRPHGRHWQWAPHNIATTYAIPLSKRHTYRIRQRMIAHDEWEHQSNDRMIVEIIDHSNDSTYILLADDDVTSPPHPNMREPHNSPQNDHLLTHRSPVMHTSLARSGYNWPQTPRERNDQHFADIFISFPRHVNEPRDDPPRNLLQALHSFTTRLYVDVDGAMNDTALIDDRRNNPTQLFPRHTNHTGRMIELLIQIRPLSPS